MNINSFKINLETEGQLPPNPETEGIEVINIYTSQDIESETGTQNTGSNNCLPSSNVIVNSNEDRKSDKDKLGSKSKTIAVELT